MYTQVVKIDTEKSTNVSVKSLLLYFMLDCALNLHNKAPAQ